MNITINEIGYTLPEGETVLDALALISEPSSFAIALNGEFVAQQNYGSTELKEGDKLDILTPIQGG